MLIFVVACGFSSGTLTPLDNNTCRFARGVTSNSNDYSDIASELARFESVLDKLGNTPRSFCDGTPTFESPDGEWHVADVSPEYFRM